MNLSLYLVTDAELCRERGVVDTVRRAVDGGVTIVQLRDKNASHDEHLAQLEAIADVTAGRARIVVNDRLDVALSARSRGIPLDGVHLGQNDDAVLSARRALGKEALIGLTANAQEHLRRVAALPRGTVDYLGVGVIRPTATKKDHPPAIGVRGFEQLASSSPLPCVAIGGIRLSDVAALRRAGAAGVAVVSALCSAADPSSEAARFLNEWEGTR